MELAFELAAQSHNISYPNPAVGCVIVRNGDILSTGKTNPPGERHAEAEALHKLKGSAEGATVYVTLEPCSHYGRTPPCSLALIQSGVQEVIIAIGDPNDPVDGKGIQQMREAGIVVRVGLLQEKAREWYQDYFFYLKHGRPRIILKIAESSEGSINEAPGRRTAITGKEVQEWTHNLRNRVHGVLVGGGTVRIDNPDLTPRLIPMESRQYPESIVWTSQSTKEWQKEQENNSYKLFQNDRPAKTILIAPEGNCIPFSNSVDSFPVIPQTIDMEEQVKNVLNVLDQRGYHSVLVEGGPFLWRAFLESGVWDQLYIFTSPKSFPKGQKWRDFCPKNWEERSIIRTFSSIGEDSMVEWVPKKDMFTGIVEEVGLVGQIVANEKGQEIQILCSKVLSDLALGDSISCNGACLSVTELDNKGFKVYAVAETLSKTALKSWKEGTSVNLERAMLPTTRLGGHWVSGHVDGIGTVHKIETLEDGSWEFTVDLPSEQSRYCISKGSITLNGVSLTIANLEPNKVANRVQVALIPITLEKTNLSKCQEGDPIHVEVDLLGKYVERLFPQLQNRDLG
jgi:diaminohydroxyphosphoribosylaminopyrimidine deaminase/5-amino-6-(5-phosphoribosylamino)uracil reductase